MAAPFFDNISGTVTVAPAAGAFTLNGAASGAAAWSTIPGNQIVNYYALEGNNWEEGIGLWNGTSLSRALIESSTGALVSFGAGVVVSLTVPADEVQPHIGGGKWGLWTAVPQGTVGTIIGLPAVAVLGTAALHNISFTAGALGRLQAVKYTSATTATSLGGLSFPAAGGAHISTNALMGGFECVARFGGLTAIPTGARLQVGMSPNRMTTVAPSTIDNCAVFLKDEADTNIQFFTRNTVGTKVDTGIPLVANAVYEASISCAPGSNRIYYTLIRLDTGAIFTGSTTTTPPAVDVSMGLQCLGSTGATTGTAFIMHIASLYLRSSF